MSKTCTCCQQSLNESLFHKHSQKKDGLNSWCKACEKIKQASKHTRNPLCSGCKSVPHMNGNAYCYSCDRKRKGRGNPKWISRRTGLEWCKICERNPSLSYHQYCHDCKIEYERKRRYQAWRRRQADPDKRRKQNARQYATNLLQRGKIRRGPCVFCGNPGTAFHHYDYEDRTRNFDDVCRPCHDTAHKFLKIMLTIHRTRIIGFASAH